MKMQWILVSACALSLASVGCKDDATGSVVDSGMMGSDSGDTDMGRADGGTDMGRTDMGGGTDMGGSDPCAASAEDDLSAQAGCNGGLLGAASEPNQFGGTCTGGSDENPAGTCTDTGAVCDGSAGGDTGICLVACEAADTYTSTSTCPTGSRCFTFESAGIALCYPDCESATDCATAVCDNDGSCAAPEAPPEDAGVPDMSVPEDGGEPLDLSVPDLGLPEDGGVAPVALVVPCEGATIAQTITASVGEGFNPAETTVSPGDVVQFTNADSFPHTVTSRTSSEGEPVMSSQFNGTLPGSSSICMLFSTAGSYPYYCMIHTSMRAVLNVSDL